VKFFSLISLFSDIGPIKTELILGSNNISSLIKVAKAAWSSKEKASLAFADYKRNGRGERLVFSFTCTPFSSSILRISSGVNNNIPNLALYTLLPIFNISPTVVG